MTTGVWETLKGEAIVDSTESMVRRVPPMPATLPSFLARLLLWATGLTQRGKPPRDQTARTRRHLVTIVLGWGLAGAGLLRVLQLLGVV